MQEWRGNPIAEMPTGDRELMLIFGVDAVRLLFMSFLPARGYHYRSSYAQHRSPGSGIAKNVALGVPNHAGNL
jgi:hypothetical protein